MSIEGGQEILDRFREELDSKCWFVDTMDTEEHAEIYDFGGLSLRTLD